MRLARFIPLAFISIAAAAAEPRAAAPAAPQPLTTVTYDFSELIHPNRPDDQPDPTPKTLSADMPIGSTSITRSESREKLVSLVQETIDPRSWRADGGPNINVDGDRFVIRQTAENHRHIASLLKQLVPGDAAKLLNRFQAAPRLPPNTRFDKTELADAVAAVAKAVGIPIDVDYKSLTKFNVEFDTPVAADVSAQVPPRALRTLIRAAANLELPLNIDSSATSIKVAAAPPPRDEKASTTRIYDCRHLPARAAGLDPTKSYPRPAVLEALCQRVRKECSPTAIREVGAHLVVTAPFKTQEHVARFLDELDTPPPPAKP